MIRDIEISDDDVKVLFSKQMFHETEIILAKCFGFMVDLDNKLIVATIAHTTKKSMYEFIGITFRSFNESLAEKPRRDAFFEKLDVIYSQQFEYADQIVRSKVPYYDQFYAHQSETLANTFWKQNIFLAFEMGLGKCQPIDGLVLTPNGFKKMGQINTFDFVIGSNGQPTQVTGIYPQGKQNFYNITFTDGTIVEACGDHLFNVQKPIQKWRGDTRYETKSVKELIGDIFLSGSKNVKWFIPMVEPIHFNSSEILLDPYLMGVLLGDGGLTQKSISITNTDNHLLKEVVKRLPSNHELVGKNKKDYRIRLKSLKKENQLAYALAFYGLKGKGSSNKFIPFVYKYNSVEIRLNVLSGLLDTDGYCSKKGTIQYYSVSETLANDVIELVQSLGGIARKTQKVGSYKKNGVKIICKVCFILTINLPEKIIPFKIPRKINRMQVDKKYHPSRGIIKIDFSRVAYGQCISVAAENKLYVMDKYVVTHNTVTSASISRIHQIRLTVIMCPAAVKWNWMADLIKFGFNQLYFTMLDASKSRTFRAFDERFIIINYDILDKYLPLLMDLDIGHFIFDEAQLLKNHLSARAKHVHKLMEHFPNSRKTFLSGTPIANRVNDIFNYLKIIGHELGNNHKKFLEQFTITASGRGGERVTGGKNLQDLHLKLSNFMIRKTKDDCLDLPDKIYLNYKFELDDYRDEYNAIIKEMSEQKSLSSLTGNVHSLNIITAKAKKKGIIELAETIIGDGRKVVIFGGYKDPLNELAEYFGHRCVKIDGSVDSFMRNEHVKRFIADPECTVFLGNWQAAGVGINLVNAADIIVQSFPLTPAALYQGLDRLHRIGQSKAVNVHYTFCEDSIDEHLHALILDKEGDINAVIDNGKELILRENMIEVLIKKLLKRDDIIFESPFRKAHHEVPGEEIKEAETEPGSISSTISIDDGSGIYFSGIKSPQLVQGESKEEYRGIPKSSMLGKERFGNQENPRYYLVNESNEALYICDIDQFEKSVDLDQNCVVIFSNEKFEEVLKCGRHYQMTFAGHVDLSFPVPKIIDPVSIASVEIPDSSIKAFVPPSFL